MSKKNYDSILRMARGAIEERVDYEMDRVMTNILDPNTKASQKRKITLSIELMPDEDRQQIRVSVTAKSTLAPTNPGDHLPLCDGGPERGADGGGGHPPDPGPAADGRRRTGAAQNPEVVRRRELTRPEPTSPCALPGWAGRFVKPAARPSEELLCKTKNRESFVFYRSFLGAIQEMEQADQLAMF